MRDIIIAIMIMMSASMFLVKREHKLMFIFIYLICFSSVGVPSIYNPIYYFIFSEILYFGNAINRIKHHKVALLLFIIFLLSFITYIHSPHLQGIRGVYLIFNNDFVYKYFFVVYAIITYDKDISPKRLFNVIAFAMAVLTIFGIINFITRYAVFVDWYIQKTLNLTYEDAGHKFTNDLYRFRVQAMHYNPFDYGFICSIIALLAMYFKKKKYIKTGIFVFVLICCYFGIITCRCRTILIITIISHPLFYILSNKLTRSSVVTMLFIILGVYLYDTLPQLQNGLDFVTSVIDEKKSYGGSTISMREEQFASVLYYIKDDLLFGKGLYYFREDLGWKYGVEGSVDKELYGMEGVYLSYLLERGFIGFLLYLIFWSLVIYVIIRYRKYDRASSALCLSVISSYMLFAFATGELQSVPLTLLVLGIGLVMQYRYKREYFSKIAHYSYNNSSIEYQVINTNDDLSQNNLN